MAKNYICLFIPRTLARITEETVKYLSKTCPSNFRAFESAFHCLVKSVYEYAIHIFIVHIFAPGTASIFLRQYKLEILPILHIYLFIN
jgi:hypothetical protein